MEDWQSTMDAATQMAEANGLEFHELRNAWGRRQVERDAEFYKDQGVTASDMNHMLYDAVKHDTMALARFAAKLGSDKAQRTSIVYAVAEAAGIHPDLALQQLREFCAPVDEVDA